MMSRVGHCPACGALVDFHIGSSLVTICEYCHSAVARGDKRLEDLGKVADLVQTQSPLRLGLAGNFGGKSYDVVGRVQYHHPAGGVWDEWYLSFGGDRWGWLAEAQGRFYVTFEARIRGSAAVPVFDALEVGQAYNLGPNVGLLKVGEKNEGLAASAQGEIPWRFQPGTKIAFADLYGPNGKFATLDYSETETRLYLGDEVPLSALGLAKEAFAEERPVPSVQALLLNCPKCGGPLSLHAPDAAQRVACPNCRALLDVEQGNLRYLSTLNRSRIKPLIPLGATGNLGGQSYTVIGFLVRSVTEGGRIYPWQEYLLYDPTVGFRWLVDSGDHWSFVSPVNPGDVDDRKGTAVYGGHTFRIFDMAPATVRHVLGEFYWKVEIGEEVEVRDMIAPPQILSIETSPGEQNFSLGIYMPPDRIEAAFDLKNIKRPWSVGANQPAPPIGPMLLAWGAFAVLLFLLDGAFSARSHGPKVDQMFLFYSLLLISIVPAGVLFHRFSFEKRRWQESRFNPYSSSASHSDDSDD